MVMLLRESYIFLLSFGSVVSRRQGDLALSAASNVQEDLNCIARQAISLSFLSSVFRTLLCYPLSEFPSCNCDDDWRRPLVRSFVGWSWKGEAFISNDAIGMECKHYCVYHFLSLFLLVTFWGCAACVGRRDVFASSSFPSLSFILLWSRVRCVKKCC